MNERSILRLTADKRETEDSPKIAFGDFSYPHNIIRNAVPK